MYVQLYIKGLILFGIMYNLYFLIILLDIIVIRFMKLKTRLISFCRICWCLTISKIFKDTNLLSVKLFNVQKI